MRVKFKNDSNIYECSEPVEQKIFKTGVAAGWTMMFHIYGNTNSTEVDEIITPENISELIFYSDNGEKMITISGYTTITSCIIRHKEKPVSELQFVKTVKITTEEVTENA